MLVRPLLLAAILIPQAALALARAQVPEEEARPDNPPVPEEGASQAPDGGPDEPAAPEEPEGAAPER